MAHGLRVAFSEQSRSDVYYFGLKSLKLNNVFKKLSTIGALGIRKLRIR